MKRSLLLILQLFAICSIGQGIDQSACTYEISGRVLDAESKVPLGFVSVQLNDGSIGAETNESGYFSFKSLCDKEYDLTFRFLGYKLLEHHHDFHHPFIEVYLAPDGFLLESVVIEAEPQESSLESLTGNRVSGNEIDALASETLGDALSEIAGVSTLKTGQNIVKPIIHGLHSNRILIINNGLRHEFQNWGEDHAPEVDPSLVNSLEVVKGAGTVRFGPDALGGVVLVNPEKIELSSPWSAKLRLQGRSNGQAGDGSVEVSKGFRWLTLQGGGSWAKQGDLSAPNYLLTNTGKEENSYFSEIRIHPWSKLDITGSYSRVEQNLGVLGGSVFGNLDDVRRAFVVDTPLYTLPFSYDIAEPRQAIQHESYKANVKYISDKQSIELKYGHQLNKRQEFGVRRSEAPNIDLELATQSLDLDWIHPTLGLLTGRMGAQLLKKANDNQPGTNTVPFIPNYDERRLGIYLIEAISFENFDFEAGLRYDYLESDITGREPDNTIYRNTILYENFSGTLGMRLNLSEHATFRSNFGTAWRAPNVAELYRFGQHAFFLEYGLWRYTINDKSDFVSTREGILDQSDREVPSEQGYKWINTFNLKKEAFSLEVTAYVNYINNYIYSRPAGITRNARGSFIFYIYDQTDALFWGIDLQSQMRHSPAFSSEIKGSFLWSKQLNPEDFFAAQPPPQIGYSLTFAPSLSWLKNAELGINLDYTFQHFQHPRTITVEEFLYAFQEGIDRFANDASDFDLLAPPPAFLLTNLKWSQRWKRFSYRLEVRNLFNVAYRTYTDRLRYFADDLGRNFLLTISLDI